MLRFHSLGFKSVPGVPQRFATKINNGSISARIQRRKLSSVSTDLFDKILIANRGEIACRVIKTAKKMGIKCVAVFSSADKDAMHVQLADEAYLIGPPPSKESYLRGDKIIEIAKRSGAKAIHPGYGFLSENAEFADLCEKNDITFIGPPSSAIRAMGSKSASKNIMSNASVPLIPGYHGEDQSMATLLREADKIGYPVLVKAVLGGGGKGMRIIERKEDFEEGLAAAKREALNSFNDDKILIEKYLTEPRHIEFQVFADKHGNVVYLHERDCSVQRRYQKVLEEAPAPHMSPELRKKMGQAAVAAAKAVGYVGAGTVEFIVDANNPNNFYFMEMNTRLQVEHPITEMITKQDLVEWQINAAANRRIPLKQDEIPLVGHAFEARIYAENPDNNFFPGTGRLIHLSTPHASNHVRIDTGVRQGDEVSVFYDPMIAKLVVWDHDRKAALQRMLHALEQYQVIGLTTNITFLKRLVTHPQFVLGNVGTFFINRYRDTLLPPPKPIPGYAVGLASLGVILNELTTQYPGSSLEPNSPFAANNARRLNMNHTRDIQFLDGENTITVSVQYNTDGSFGIKLPGSTQFVPAKGSLDGTELTASIGDELIKSTVVVNDFTIHVFAHGQSFSLKIPVKDYSGASAVKGSLLSPMPGRITKVLVQPGDKVKKGQPLIIMEAMKMEHTIRSPVDGAVKKINYKVNDLVGEKQLLAAIEEEGK